MISAQFFNKHKDNSEMMEIIDQVSGCVDTSNLTQANHEIICEVVYGIKKLYAEPYDISMDTIYNNLYLLKSISYVSPSELPGRASGMFCALQQDSNGNYYSEIKISNAFENNLNINREIVAHELVHVGVQTYVYDAEGNVCGCKGNGLPYQHLNEIFVQDISAKILEYHGHDLYKYEKTINYEGKIAEELSISSVGYGYSNISPLANPLSASYPKELYQELFLHENQFHNALDISNSTENILESIERKFVNLETSSNPIEHMNYYSGLYTDCEKMLNHRLESDKNINLSEYLKIAQNFRENSYMIFVDGEPVLMSDAVSQTCEIKSFYRNFNTSADMEKEINPLTRSRDCENFILAIGCLKDSGRLYTEKELENFQWAEISSSGHNRELFVQCGDDKFMVFGVKEKGLIALSEFEETDMILNPSLLSTLTKNQREQIEDFTLIEKRELSMITGYSKHVLQNEKNPNDVIFYSIADGKMAGNFFESLNKSNLMDLKDYENNNIYHVLANSINSNNDNFYAVIGALKPNDTNALLFEENVDGITPINAAFKNNNIGFINALRKGGITFEGQQGEHIKDGSPTLAEHILMGNRKPYLCELVEQNYFKTFEAFIKSKTNINGQDVNGNTLLHYLSVGNKIALLNNDILDTISHEIYAPNACNKNGETALIKLTQGGFVEKSFDYLINNVGIDPSISDVNNRNALHNVLQETNKAFGFTYSDIDCDKFNRCLDILIQRNVDINNPCTDYFNPNYKITPLQIACGMNCESEQPLNYEGITKLIQSGAHITNETYGYKSPLEHVCNTGDVEMMGAFIKAGVPLEVFDFNESINMASKFKLYDLSTKYPSSVDIVEEVKEFIMTKLKDIDLTIINNDAEIETVNEVAATKETKSFGFEL